jgi:hypothetical protein
MNNITDILVEIVKEDFGLKSQTDIADKLGIYQSQLTSYINKNSAKKRVVKSMIKNLVKAYQEKLKLSPTNTFEILDKIVESKTGLKKQTEKAAVLSINQPQLAVYISKNNAKHRVTKDSITSLVDYFENKLTENSIKPIFEYKRVAPRRHNKKYGLLLDPNNEDLLRDKLKGKYGLYVYYDSQARPLYIGKANKTELYSEMTNRLSRKAEYHLENLKAKKLENGEMTCYISAYEITPKDFIDNFEALLIRIFKNTLTNIKVENFG